MKARPNDSDEEMPDAEPDEDVLESREVATPRDDADDAATPAADDQDDDEDEEDEDDDDGPVITTIPRRKRPQDSRRSTTRRGDDTPEPGNDEGSESGTPYRRRKAGRQSSGRASNARARPSKRAQADNPHVLVDGERVDVINDEALVDQDDEGDEKVDELGNLLGGREYRVRTFKIVDRGDRLYMLSTEPARCCGFRDSYLFFAKHPKLYKLLLSETQKKDLIDREILPNSYKGRNIGVVTARSVFREFGARIIVGGRRITDDYKANEARADGVEEGVLADPEDRLPGHQEEYNRNRYVAWFGASDVYRTSASQQGVDKKSILAARKRNNVTATNWQAVHAREACTFNTRIAQVRKATQAGVYDHNTNMMFLPKTTQPTHVKWEQVSDAAPDTMVNGHTNGVHDSEDSIFKPLPPQLTNSFTVVDITYKAPPISNIGYPGPDSMILDSTSGTNGLAGIADDIVDELPADCRLAFEQARDTERHWKNQWSTEARSALRGDLKIGFVGYPV